ncbi:nuclear transport factor 2 family protein [Vibrio tritonius]|uniref:Nuclear transport factor 2 family protein n=1 Tax=Vibrio tritonius TaxID=1435069 RepID=A0ABS7YQE1_9VIBR|nr:nuclear transport factor 2 family protein [Vibrio tritonius]MCA2017891.1 nuclear transport factor 2 family protein [Vibrio tritonius]
MDVHSVAAFYQRLDKTTLGELSQIYHPNIEFQDAAHRMVGLESLQHYFQELYQNVNQCRFQIGDVFSHPEGGMITWEMELSHPKLKRGKLVTVAGVSHLKFADGKVIYHRDYFDLGEMVYEHIPVLGHLIRTIKQKLGQS